MEPNQPDNAIDKTLAALNTAAPPEGLEARIATRLAAQPAPASLWRDRFPAAWWRGVATGAAFALLAAAAVLFFQHRTAPRNHIAANALAHSPTITPVNAPESLTPCAQPAILRTHTPATSPALETAARPGSPAGSARWGGSHPIPTSPLTPLERELVRLAQTADPRALAMLNPEHQAQLEAENAAQFEKFFAPPPPPPPIPDQPAANPAANPEPSPAANRESSPATNPEAAPSPAPQLAPPTN